VLVPDNVLSWPEVAARLAAARNYWLCTTTPSGAPHAAPVWGVVTGHTLYLYSEAALLRHATLPPTRGWWCTWKAARTC
jgi:hypothetical protein